VRSPEGKKKLLAMISPSKGDRGGSKNNQKSEEKYKLRTRYIVQRTEGETVKKKGLYKHFYTGDALFSRGESTGNEGRARRENIDKKKKAIKCERIRHQGTGKGGKGEPTIRFPETKGETKKGGTSIPIGTGRKKKKAQKGKKKLRTGESKKRTLISDRRVSQFWRKSETPARVPYRRWEEKKPSLKEQGLEERRRERGSTRRGMKCQRDRRRGLKGTDRKKWGKGQHRLQEKS